MAAGKQQFLGYARLSTPDESIEAQIAALVGHGVKKNRIHIDIMSGTGTERPGLTKALKSAKAGDVFVVSKLDRLGRSVRGILDTVEAIRNEGVELFVVEHAIDTRTPHGRFACDILCDLAKVERGLALGRAVAGQRAARERGVVLGRKSTMTPEKANKARKMLWPSDGSAPATKEAVAKALGVTRTTIYNWIKSEGAKDRSVGGTLKDH